MRHLWGLDAVTPSLLTRIKGAGYDGVEGMLPAGMEAHVYRELCLEYGLDCVFQVVTCFPEPGGSVQDHVRSFRAQMEVAAQVRPRFVNAHSGVDCWEAEEAKAFFREALAIERDLGLLVAHETHRGRVLFNPRDTLAMLRAFADLKITADFSHWVNVCERLPFDQKAAFDLAIEHAVHIHARVGHEQGPQVYDPRAPQWQAHVQAHENWWSRIWQRQAARGATTSTLTPEFGPPPYEMLMPYTQAPIVNMWDVAVWQMQRQRQRFADACGA
ncbi:MAG: TIM barrel protein [Myxococcales bacterium]|nr:TIM barrel protein [Myxococcales bacterium]MCG5052855.1 TIM barrel protein [Myxococcales bacterium]